MANEFKHKTVGSELTQTEFESVGGHVLDSQAIGDIIYASSTSQLTRLGIGSTGAVLTVTGGIPAWDTTWTPTGHLIPASDDTYDLGSASAAWQDLFLEGDITLTDAGTISTTAGSLSITPASGSAIVLDTSTTLDGGVLTFTPSTDDTVVMTAATNGAFSLVTTDNAAAAANIQITADGTVDIDSAGVLTLDSGAAINIEPASGSAILLDGTISIDAGVVTGATSITSTAFVGDITGDVTGNADTATALATGRTISMTGDVAWTSASFTGAGNVTGAGTIQANAVEGSMLNTNVISGQTEITSGLAAADELLYDDGGVLKKVGLDTLTTYLAGVNAGTVASTGLSDSSGVLTLDIQNLGASTTIADADLVVVDDGADGTLKKMTRANFIESAALDAINIDGGAIDGAVIGANDAAAGTFAALVSTTFAPSDDVTLASHKYLKLPENSSVKFTDQIGVDNSIDNDDGQGIIFTFRAGATVTPFSPVYIDGNNEVQECNANAIATMPCIGVTMNTSDVSADADIEVMMLGLIRHDSFTDFGAAGAPVYASGTAGALTTTAPSGEDDVVQIVGHSIAEDLIFVQPCLTTIEHTG
jgi:hypothetical protein